MDQLPDWFAQILDFQEVMNAEQPSFDALADEIIAVADNFFFQTMDSSAIAQWEGIFNIVANPSTETMDFRRDRVLNRISTALYRIESAEPKLCHRSSVHDQPYQTGPYRVYQQALCANRSVIVRDHFPFSVGI